MLRLKLKRFMRQRSVTEVALANTIAEIVIELETKKSVSERHLRYVVQNTEPMIGKKSEHRPSLVVLGFIIKGLRRLTGENVSVSDVLEYKTLTPEMQVNLPEIPLEDDKETEKNSLPVENYELIPIESDVENAKTLDEVWELIVHSLEDQDYSELSQQVARLNVDEQDSDNQPDLTEKRRRGILPIVLTGLLMMCVGYIALDYFVLKPRLIASYTQLFATRDRVRSTSSLPVPTLIGPEGNIAQLAPTLRVAPVEKAIAYEFYVENTVSEDYVYTGPVPASNFVIPAGTLCPNTTYTWRARALGNDGWTSISSPLTFTVTSEALEPSQQYLLELTKIRTKPPAPKLIAPVGTTNTTTPTLEVTKVSNSYGYGFYIRDLLSDKIVYDNSFAGANTVTLPEGVLKNGGVYQWNARSRNCHYWSEFTPTPVFTVNVNE